MADWLSSGVSTPMFLPSSFRSSCSVLVRNLTAIRNRAAIAALVLLPWAIGCATTSHGGAQTRPDVGSTTDTRGEPATSPKPESASIETEAENESESTGTSASEAAAVEAAAVEDLLAAAEGALSEANEALAGGDMDAYRMKWTEAQDALRNVEAQLVGDPATFHVLRPAYEELFTDLREGLAPPAEPVEELDASAEELAHTEGVHPKNGNIYDMPIDPHSPMVAKYLALFQEGKRREALEQAFERSGRYRKQIQDEIRSRGLPEELWVVPVVESGFKVSAYSRARAVGLWQFMVSTARRHGLVVNEWVDERRDPIKSTRAALDYLEDLYQWFNSWDFALAAYNRGEGGIHRDIERSRIADFMEMAELGATHRETQNHVPQIHAAAIIAKNPEQYGFKLKDEPIAMDTVEIDYVIDLEVAAACAGTTEATLRDLNPELRTWVTPVLSKDYPRYVLKLPEGSASRYNLELAKVEDKTPKRQISYVVRRGETLGSISRKFGVSVASVKRWNHLRSSRIRPGQRLVLMGKGSQGGKSGGEEQAVTASKSHGVATAGDVTTHTVKKGDNLYTIAARYGTTVANLKRWNDLGRSARIFPGQALRVSDGGQSVGDGD